MIRPTGNYVLIEPAEKEETSPGGIIIDTGTADKEYAVQQTGKVIAFGPTAFKRWKGCESPMWLKSTVERFNEALVDGEGKIDPRCFEAFCDFYKWEDPDYPPHKQWGVEVGDIVEHKRYDGMASSVEGFEKFRYIPDIDILGVVSDE